MLRGHSLMWSVCWVYSYDNLIFKRIINVLKCFSMVIYNIYIASVYLTGVGKHDTFLLKVKLNFYV